MQVAHPPRITLATFTQVLRDANSPALPEVAACYGAFVQRGLDPAVALAFFAHESGYGRRGVAVRTCNWGNLRRGQGREVRNSGGWAWYRCWADGAADWAALITGYYAARGLTTVAQIVPIYAPSSDNNVPSAYIAAVLASIQRWQHLDPDAAWATWGNAYPLPDAQRDYAIPQAWLADGGLLGAAESEEVPVPLGAVRLFARGAIVWSRATNQARIYRP